MRGLVIYDWLISGVLVVLVSALIVSKLRKNTRDRRGQ